MENSVPPQRGDDPRAMYVDLLMNCLTMALWGAQDGEIEQPFGQDLKTRAKSFLKKTVLGEKASPELDLQSKRELGLDWPRLAHSMIGCKRMQNLRSCVEDVIARGVPGDLIETGVWRGGSTIFMRGICKAYGVKDRTVWVADSFQGLPAPDPEKYPADAGSIHHECTPLAISLEQVQANFASYGLLDDQVRFLKGWFKDTLPQAPIKQLAVARLDGDMYESTMDALQALYPKLSPGGYLIVDDYGAVGACKAAVEDYRKANHISEPIQPIDNIGVFWRRSA